MLQFLNRNHLIRNAIQRIPLLSILKEYQGSMLKTWKSYEVLVQYSVVATQVWRSDHTSYLKFTDKEMY